MLKKLSRNEAFEKFPAFPKRDYIEEKDEEIFFSPQTFEAFILTVSSTSINNHVKLLASQLKILLSELDIDTLTFLGDTDTPWRYQKNDYKPAKEALLFLEENRIGKKFNGALQIDTTSLNPFIKHLFWLTRCNATLAYIHFIDNRQHLVGHICKYGIIHLHSLNKNTNALLKKAFDKTSFQQIDQCIDPFNNYGPIKGRQIKL